jgi:hypothetical protein
MSESAFETCSRFTFVACGMRNDTPSRIEGNVSCGPVVSGLVVLPKLLTLKLKLLIAVGDNTRVQLVSSAW